MPLTPAQELEHLKKRLEALNQTRTRALVELEASKRQLAELSAEAESAFGTADVAKLKQLLAEKEAENRARLTAFASGLDSVEASLKQVEAALAGK